MIAPNEQHDPDIDKLRREARLMDMDTEFGRLLKGKSVIIAGPAETLLGAGLGPMIDAHDLVVRFNTAIQYMPFNIELAKDVGTRTDILYCNNEIIVKHILHQNGLTHEKFKGLCNSAGIKYLVSTNNDYTFKPPDVSEPVCRSEYLAFKRFLQQQKIEIGFRMLHSTSAVVRKFLEGYIGRTGFLAIVDLLAYDVRRLHIAGMTFYHQGGHLFIEDRVRELHPLKDHRGKSPPGDSLGHNSYLELELMRRFSRLYGPRLSFDEQLQKLLDMK